MNARVFECVVLVSVSLCLWCERDGWDDGEKGLVIVESRAQVGAERWLRIGHGVQVGGKLLLRRFNPDQTRIY